MRKADDSKYSVVRSLALVGAVGLIGLIAVFCTDLCLKSSHKAFDGKFLGIEYGARFEQADADRLGFKECEYGFSGRAMWDEEGGLWKQVNVRLNDLKLVSGFYAVAEGCSPNRIEKMRASLMEKLGEPIFNVTSMRKLDSDEIQSGHWIAWRVRPDWNFSLRANGSLLVLFKAREKGISLSVAPDRDPDILMMFNNLQMQAEYGERNR